MDREAATKQCGHLIKRRAQRQQGGGVGLLMNTGVESSEAVRRIAWRGRAIRGAIVGVALALCTAGGFASARLWDGRGTSDMDLEFAHSVAMDDQIAYAHRRSALGRLSFFAQNSVEALVECETDPRFSDEVEVFLAQLRHFLPESESLSDHLARLKEPALSDDDRLAAAVKVYIHAARSVDGLGLARDAAKKTGKPELVEEIDRQLARVRDLVDEALSGPPK